MSKHVERPQTPEGQEVAPGSPLPEELAELAREAAAKAHAPYSGLRVGAALLADSGLVVTGCNVENASFGLTICAERSAIFTYISQRKRVDDRVALLVVSTADGAPISPCGACRQVIAEHGGDCLVGFLGPQGPELRRMSELLPHAFTLGNK